MNQISNKEKAEFFDAHADSPWAAAEYTREEIEKISWLIEKTGLAPGWRVLEPGCGTGRVTEILARIVGDRGRVLAMDVSKEMVERAHKRCQGLPPTSIQHAALETMNIEREGFDLALCFNFFPHLDHKPQALSIIHRALAPEALLAIFHLEASSFINDLHRKAGTVVEHDMIPTRPQLERMLLEAGFDPLEFRDDDRYFLMARKK